MTNERTETHSCDYDRKETHECDYEMKRPTNREYIVNLLNDPNWIDDGYAAYEAMLHYNIKCPYTSGDKKAHCYGKDDDFICRDNCYYCKAEWLDSEVSE